METPRSIRDIIATAGGPLAVCGIINDAGFDIHVTAIYKWFHNGVPDRYWPAIIKPTFSSADELLAANEMARNRRAA